MHLDVFFSAEAEDTFESIAQQIESRWGEKEKNEFRRRVYEVTEIVGKFPLIFKAANKTKDVRKAFIHRNCSMFYKVVETHIEVLFFWDNRQDPMFL
ncbi:type II toxin-antitoxin system RelE/ParE family toxin [Mucilaginibacter sp. L3T2-6]|uniref:type II toxin-antitoxin system RelE/ParE family toxin n=1 Tax=Mucilaginibacter sp. L3T2-6 TaxID=3062491 RepID=UPI002675F949|nr:type II toxin-antitoxin system RelE/ParE family toxin [Mucilaginibacter sp. L3T2-6]MDO3640385.1 type II toxin-antitoxin system RelE/ParE family toxin [Mucilaginibacter sp. L3T2-6]MDV6213276.1 type II toxin-antitoxin system RelE/ParE family toxin [Mucilaginibacter sp. L3T2-6]